MDTLLEFDEKLGVVMSENERRKKYRKLGFCETCTNRLYTVKNNKCISGHKKRRPVTNQNVLNGRCLDCRPIMPSENKEEKNNHFLIQFRHSMQKKCRRHHGTPKLNKRHTINIVHPTKTKNRSNNVTKTLGENIDSYTMKVKEPRPSSRKKEERDLYLIRLRHSMQEDEPHHDTSKTHKRHATINNIYPINAIDTKINNQTPKELSDEFGTSQSLSSDDDQKKTKKNSKNTTRHHQTSCSRPETSNLSNIEHDDLDHILTEMLWDSLTLNRKKSLCKDLLSLTKNNYNSKVKIIMSGGIMIIHDNMMIGDEHSSNDEQLQKYTLALLEVLLPIADDRILNDIPIVETITWLMILHQTCRDVQERSIHILRDLADRNDERYKMLIAYSGAADVLNLVVNQFSESSTFIKREGPALIAKLLQ